MRPGFEISDGTDEIASARAKPTTSRQVLREIVVAAAGAAVADGVLNLQPLPQHVWRKLYRMLHF